MYITILLVNILHIVIFSKRARFSVQSLSTLALFIFDLYTILIYKFLSSMCSIQRFIIIVNFVISSPIVFNVSSCRGASEYAGWDSSYRLSLCCPNFITINHFYQNLYLIGPGKCILSFTKAQTTIDGVRKARIASLASPSCDFSNSVALFFVKSSSSTYTQHKLSASVTKRKSITAYE